MCPEIIMGPSGAATPSRGPKRVLPIIRSYPLLRTEHLDRKARGDDSSRPVRRASSGTVT